MISKYAYNGKWIVSTVCIDGMVPNSLRRVTHICVSKLTIIGSDNGLSPGRCQAIIWTSAGILLIGSLGTNFSEILIGIQTFSFKKMQLKMSSAKWRPFCLSLNVLSTRTSELIMHSADYVLMPFQLFNSLRPRPNRRHFADDILKCIFENENEWISPRISLKFVPEVRINNIPALVQIMAWRRPGDKPLSEPIMVSLLTHICVTRPQWVNGLNVIKHHPLDNIWANMTASCLRLTVVLC